MNRVNTEFCIKAVEDGLFKSKNALINAAVEMLREAVALRIEEMLKEQLAEYERAANAGE